MGTNDAEGLPETGHDFGNNGIFGRGAASGRSKTFEQPRPDQRIVLHIEQLKKQVRAAVVAILREPGQAKADRLLDSGFLRIGNFLFQHGIQRVEAGDCVAKLFDQRALRVNIL